jgi:hypothetical protein
MSDPLTQEERAELAALRAQRDQAQNTAGTSDTPAAAKTLPDEAYDFKVGQLLRTVVNGSDAFGIVVERGPMSTPTPSGETLPGYRVAAIGPINDMPATKEDLGLTEL